MAKKELEYNGARFAISYEIQNPKAKPTCIILHGWGSNKNIMKQAFGNYLQEYRHLYIDLPGFGASSNDIVLTTEDYAKIIGKFLDTLGVSADIALGHSFGGKVATLLGPKLLVLVASAGIVVEKSPTTKLKIKTFKLLKSLGLSSLRKYFVASDAKELKQNMYETFKNVVDEDFSEKFRSFSNRALLFWGDKDTATPLATAYEIEKLIKNATLHVYGGDHYFFLQHAKEIATIIKEHNV